MTDMDIGACLGNSKKAQDYAWKLRGASGSRHATAVARPGSRVRPARLFPG